MRELFREPIDDTQFEEFCYDLLGGMGFKNRNWRKGTPLSNSPADRGRDIQCQLPVQDVDGSTRIESWFVECKHHSRGVSPEKLQSALSWAVAERPDKLLIVCSGFLSNPAKDYLDRYKSENHPPFVIKVWERPTLVDLCANKLDLVRRYGLRSEVSCVSILKVSHLQFLKTIPFNSLAFFFSIIDPLDPHLRDTAFSWVYYLVFPRKTETTKTHGDIVLTDYVDTFGYPEFKRYCIALAARVSEPFVVNSIVQWTLQGLLGISDTTTTEERIQQARNRKELTENLEELPPDRRERYLAMFDESLRSTGGLFSSREEAIQSFIRVEVEFIRDVRERTKKNYELYEWFCDSVVARLLEERLVR